MPFSFSHQSAWLVTASFVAGTLNAVAGGGSFLSFPALLGVGVLPIAANATNTVALWPGQLTSIAAYREDLGVNLRLLIPVSPGPSCCYERGREPSCDSFPGCCWLHRC